MRTNGQILQKVKQIRFRHVKREVDDLLKRIPRNCSNQRKVQSSTGPLGICKLDCQTCDALVSDRSEACPDFTPLHSRDEIKDSLNAFFEGKSIPEIAIRYPDVAALLWVLEDEAQRGNPGEEYYPEMVPVGTYGGVQIYTESESSPQAIKDYLEGLQQKVEKTEKELELARSQLVSAENTIAEQKEKENLLISKHEEFKKKIQAESEAIERKWESYLNPEPKARTFWERLFR